MNTYIVGGAVRDVLLGLHPKDFDFVHVGTTPEQMVANGYKPIDNASFPIFLDNDGQEHALARKERKNGTGYNGFECFCDPSVTLSDDLFRRDLTCNAMAVHIDNWPKLLQRDVDVAIRYSRYVIDPFNGYQDLLTQKLHPVSEHFSEDPVRVLRAARFSARYNFGWSEELIRQAVNLQRNGELKNLTRERVWKEMSNALSEQYAVRFFTRLQCSDTLQDVLPNYELYNYDMLLMSGVTPSTSIAVKLGLILSGASSEQFETERLHLGMPNDVAKVCTVVRNCNTLLMESRTAENLYRIINTMSLDKVPNSSLMWRCLREYWNIKLTDLTVSDIMLPFDVLIELTTSIMSIKFDTLSDDVKLNLTGPAIGKAIAEERLKLISNFLTM